MKTKTAFLEFLIGNTEKGTYDEGYMDRRKKKTFITTSGLNASQKAEGYTKTKISVTPGGVLGHGKN